MPGFDAPTDSGTNKAYHRYMRDFNAEARSRVTPASIPSMAALEQLGLAAKAKATGVEAGELMSTTAFHNMSKTTQQLGDLLNDARRRGDLIAPKKEGGTR